MRFLWAAFGLVIGAGPRFLPDQDVVVTYELRAPHQDPQDFQLNYDAAGERARVESLAQGFYVLADLPAGRAQVVLPQLHAVVRTPDFSGLTQMIANGGDARFTPLGHGRYAGLGCERYLVMNDQGTATACITHDGVILHFNGHNAHGAADVTALSVAFAPQPAAAFLPPAGFSMIELPPGTLLALLRPQ
jgi:hypothetical protein